MIARRRAGMSQRELAGRLGVAAGTVGRWERGAVEPSFRAVEEAVCACGLDLVLEFAKADNGSWNSMIYEQLRRAPAERVRHLSGGGFDRVEVLKLIGGADVRAIVVGETAGALHGWPLMLDGPGGVDLLVPSEEREQVEHLLAEAEDRERIHVCEALPGAWGYADLARNCVRMEVDGVAVRVGALVDLLRVAHSEVGGFSGRFAIAFDETLQLSERMRLGLANTEPRKMTEQEAREAVEEWLARQTPVER